MVLDLPPWSKQKWWVQAWLYIITCNICASDWITAKQRKSPLKIRKRYSPHGHAWERERIGKTQQKISFLFLFLSAQSFYYWLHSNSSFQFVDLTQNIFSPLFLFILVNYPFWMYSACVDLEFWNWNRTSIFSLFFFFAKPHILEFLSA